jgi:hypothetical protein
MFIKQAIDLCIIRPRHQFPRIAHQFRNPGMPFQDLTNLLTAFSGFFVCLGDDVRFLN